MVHIFSVTVRGSVGSALFRSMVDTLTIVILPHGELRVQPHLWIVFLTLFHEGHGLGRVRRTSNALLLQALEDVVQG